MLKNYLGQLRMYSYVDLLLLLMAVKSSTLDVIAASMLWFGFLIFLEWIHKDKGRNKWPLYAWLIPWLVGIIIIQRWETVFFILLAVIYTLKKRYPVGLVAPLINGLLKVSLILLVSKPQIEITILIFVLFFIRNLMGDIRDAHKDSSEKVITLPVLMGYKKHTPYVYPLFLGFTSFIWVQIGNLPIWLVPIGWLIQLGTYHLTPR